MELTFYDVELDNGEWGTLYIDVTPQWENCSFTAHNLLGMMQSYGGREIAGFKVDSVVLYNIDKQTEYNLNNGQWQEYIDYNEVLDALIEDYNNEND